MEKINTFSAKNNSSLDIEFISVNLDDHDRSMAMIKSKNLTSMSHVSVNESTREILKVQLNMKSVPFLLLVSKNGKILASGNPKNLSMEHIKALTITNNGNRENSKDHKRKILNSEFNATESNSEPKTKYPIQTSKVNKISERGFGQETKYVCNEDVCYLVPINKEAKFNTRKPLREIKIENSCVPVNNSSPSSSFEFTLDEDF
eukprot:CAMPEP_0171466110 /NCGR_PEP_ID=MMETSP0945-20130129/8994_1 /TAXON_ID=109269 /ORGANISM="Vaucheria litorea, Strain CCMP2940" /LENGTH=203 /DNA_ID=CAMNT_0011994001 /DNA_START=238 /DNA_END=849 /DNA_ORIENTATION=-